MEVQTAIDLINNLCYSPGWSFECTDYTKRHEGTIHVLVRYPAHETNRPEAKDGYPVMNEGRASYMLMVHGLDMEAFYHTIAWMLMDIHEHEMREALRVPPTYWSPFHPHHIDGIRRWEKHPKHVKRIRAQQKDLKFGVPLYP